MPKTYNSIPTVSTGDVYTATAHNNIVTNVNNYRVPPAVSLQKSIANTTAGTTWDFTLAGDEEFDTDDMHSITTNTTRITIQTAGIYLFQASAFGGYNAGDEVSIALYKNGTALANIVQVSAMESAGYSPGPSLSHVASCAVNDWFIVTAFVSINRTLTCRFSAVWLGQVS
jgi:hypothetical protein